MNHILAQDPLNKLYCVYLLVSKNIRYKGRVYIGFTVNPSRRLKQHNKGRDFGGAFKTSGRGPWDMVLFVYGFPNEITALRFEWAWQHPDKSRRLKFTDSNKKKRLEPEHIYRIRLMNYMLHVGPWYRLPLVINIVSSEYIAEIRALNTSLPHHMKILEGTVQIKFPIVEQKEISNSSHQSEQKCKICFEDLETSSPSIFCNTTECHMVAHLICMANLMLKDSMQVIPTEGNCPTCSTDIHYGQLISQQLLVD